MFIQGIYALDMGPGPKHTCLVAVVLAYKGYAPSISRGVRWFEALRAAKFDNWRELVRHPLLHRRLC